MSIWFLHIDDFDENENGYPAKLYSGKPPEGELINSGLIGASWRPGTANFDDTLALFSEESPDGEKLNAIGHDLFAQIHHVLDGHVDKNSDGFLLLAFCDDLRPLPWERILQENVPVFAKGSLLCMRVHKELPQNEITISDWPLRMLIVMGAKDDDKDVLGQKEIDAITDVLIPFEPNIDYEICIRPKADQLKKKLEEHRPHIFHFIGHGDIENGKGYLEICSDKKDEHGNVVCDEHGNIVCEEWFWEADDIRNQITDNNDETDIRLAYINACLSSGDSTLWSVSDAFLSAGVPAVIGMHDEVRGPTAVELAREFYSALSEKPSHVASALKSARAEFIRAHGIKDLEWSSPCLEVQCMPNTILDVCIGVEPERVKLLNSTLGSHVREFVGRRSDARKATFVANETSSQLHVLHGASEVGKTSMAELLLERLVFLGVDVHYINLAKAKDDSGSKNELPQLLNLSLNGGSDADDALSLITEAYDLAAVDGDTQEEYQGYLTSHEANPADEAVIEKLAGAFGKMLLQATQGKPTVLVYDHLSGMRPDELKGTVWPFLSTLSKVDNIQVVVILDDTKKELEKFFPTTNLGLLESKFGVCLFPLDQLNEEKSEQLLTEFLYRLYIVNDMLGDYREEADELARLVKFFYKKKKDSSWKTRFTGLRYIYQELSEE